MKKLRLDIQYFASNTINGSSTASNCDCQIIWSSTPNNTTNKSSVTAEVQVKKKGSSSTQCTFEGTLKIDGTSYSISKYSSWDWGEWHTVGKKTKTVTHDEDGTKSISISCNIKTADDSTSMTGTYTASGTAELDDIPRHSVLYEIEDFDIETGFVLNYTKYIDSYSNTLEIYDGDTLLKVIEDEDLVSGETYLLSDDINTIYNIMSDSNEHTFTFKLITNMPVTLNSTNTDIKTGIGYITNANPIFNSCTYEVIDEKTLTLTNNNQLAILGVSDVQLIISEENKPVAQKGATMQKIVVVNDGIEYSYGIPQEYPLIIPVNKIAQETIDVIAVDSRGNVTNIYIGFYLVNYTEPKISLFNIDRESRAGTSVKLNLNAKVWEGNFGNGNNQVTRVRYKVSTDGINYSELYDITEPVLNIIGTSTTFIIDEDDGIELHADGTSGGFIQGTSYYIQLLLTDGVGETELTTIYSDISFIDDGNMLDSYYKKPNGKYQYAINGMVDINNPSPLQVYDDDGQDTLNPIGCIRITSTNVGIEEMSKRYGGTWKLIDKTFKNSFSASEDDIFEAESGVTSSGSVAYIREGHSVRLRVGIVTAMSLNDTNQTLGEIDMERLGTTSTLYTPYVLCYVNDDAVGIVQFGYNSGVLTWAGLVGESTSVASGSTITLDFIIPTHRNYMPDEFCDKFYWERIA